MSTQPSVIQPDLYAWTLAVNEVGGWQEAKGREAYVEVLGDFTAVVIEGALEPGERGQKLQTIVRALPLMRLGSVPRYLRPRIVSATGGVRVLIYFPMR